MRTQWARYGRAWKRTRRRLPALSDELESGRADCQPATRRCRRWTRHQSRACHITNPSRRGQSSKPDRICPQAPADRPQGTTIGGTLSESPARKPAASGSPHRSRVRDRIRHISVTVAMQGRMATSRIPPRPWALSPGPRHRTQLAPQPGVRRQSRRRLDRPRSGSTRRR